MPHSKPESIDSYIAGFPADIQQILEVVRTTVRSAAPDSVEVISYDMPGFKLHGGYIAHFAAFKKHIGFYPAPTGVPEFEKDLAFYKIGKGSVQFPFDKPMPLELITKITKFNVQRNLKKAEQKRMVKG
ncbi:hypothetical protein DYBT9275_06103 [Dyadobacter sp. CECT 9275]|uniref:YdhG-like domain-containing protein n=1 Tax=Dyadobacter helix TaxID=2822344 RepID=A0A916JI03_9BACT|nr:DUF1801 domain-containing protein [Dyadobacter sp. CECT 9275]CAG5018932.1 hypothetical protein DYBT9275_06103 [Dyadobacter sp. CECT 9275]